MIKAIDAHIHLDMYMETDATTLLAELAECHIEGLIAVSRHLDSCKATERLLMQAPEQVFAAYGYHPEQEIPTDNQLNELIQWIRERSSTMVAVGEIGLPYYMRLDAEAEGRAFELAPYIALLERFLKLAASLDKPVVLHAVYEDADIVCDLLEKHGIKKAHFHWFKGLHSTVERMIQADYYISITPDVLYEEEIRTLVREYPIALLMVETDGPWPFEGPFEGQQTHPRMIHAVVEQIAFLKGLPMEEAALKLLNNTKQFYGIPSPHLF
ncbi:TatD family hydrolase [Paenibacillus frigoriresistens]|uniref:TatD family hydrolase n=1 Tax=Paenibacillus alginolyticus TaxID=59839 RepID=UPI0015651EDA|nr:TatD family hydrolase [Paenibacillus frigoriresistens]NRF92931.1 TatD family hydrolase [Paenibacillus frigoriresistens]